MYLSIFALFFAIILFYHSSNKSKKSLLTSVLIALLVSFIFPVIFQLTRKLGADSFLELQKFELSDAAFYITTYSIENALRWDRFFSVITVFCLSFLFFRFLASKFNLGPLLKLKTPIALLAIFWFAYLNFATFKLNSFVFENVKDRFRHKLDFSHSSQSTDKIKVIVYIGESTSSLNMSLYGYPRKTTPKLDSLLNDGLLVYRGVLSTHTHTTQSLLEALSLPLFENPIKPITEKDRYAITSLLQQFDIQTFLYSNQGQSGSFNLASPIIFGNSETHYSTKSVLSGNKDKELERPFDRDYFLSSLEQHFLKQKNDKEVIFLHSYAGHGEYLKYIPKNFHQKIDDYSRLENIEKILKKPEKDFLDTLDSYDSAIRYVDDSVYSVVDFIKTKDEPIVLVYFSDHGDSAFDKSGHDSARANFAMLKIPYLLYFNQAARSLYPEKFVYFSQIANDRFSLLDQFPRTLIDLFGINIGSLPKDLVIPSPIGSGKVDHTRGFFVRDAAEGAGYISTNASDFNEKNYGDSLTGTFIRNKQSKSDEILCMHATNNIESMVKGKVVSNCLEFDLVVSNDQLSIYHPPAKDTNFLINEMINSNTKNMHFWVDSKNIDNPKYCRKLYGFLKDNKRNYKSIMVEFPPATDIDNAELLQCASDMRKESIDISYYIDTDIGKKCIKKKDLLACNLLSGKLKTLKFQRIFNNISYDKKLAPLINQYDNGSDLLHNSWGFLPNELNGLSIGEYKRVIYKNN